MELNIYLTFDGNCKQAFDFYSGCLGATIDTIMPYSEMPGAGDMPAAQKDKIMHASMSVGGQTLMGADAAPDQPCESMKGAHVSINVDSVDEAERVYAALSANGSVQMPLQKTFWAARFGMFTDQYGVQWMVNCNG